MSQNSNNIWSNDGYKNTNTWRFRNKLVRYSDYAKWVFVGSVAMCAIYVSASIIAEVFVGLIW